MLEVCVATILTIRVPFFGQWKQNLEKKGKKPGIKYSCFWIANSGWSWNVKQERHRPPGTHQTPLISHRWVKKILELENQPLSFTVRDFLHRSKSLACIIWQSWAGRSGTLSSWAVTSAPHSWESTEGSLKFQWQPMILQQFQSWTFCPLTRRFVVTCSSVRSTTEELQILGILFTALLHIWYSRDLPVHGDSFWFCTIAAFTKFWSIVFFTKI